MSEDNIGLFNRLWLELQAKWAPNSTRYSTVIDYKDLLDGEKNEWFKGTQQNKPSPIGPYEYAKIAGIERKMPSDIKWERSYVGWTNSMEPTIDYGDLVIRCSYKEWKEKCGELRPGQVAIYENANGGRIIHRYIGKTSDGKFVFRGDNNYRPDYPVSEDKIIDVVWFTIPTYDKIKEGQD